MDDHERPLALVGRRQCGPGRCGAGRRRRRAGPRAVLDERCARGRPGTWCARRSAAEPTVEFRDEVYDAGAHVAASTSCGPCPTTSARCWSSATSRRCRTPAELLAGPGVRRGGLRARAGRGADGELVGARGRRLGRARTVGALRGSRCRAPDGAAHARRRPLSARTAPARGPRPAGRVDHGVGRRRRTHGLGVERDPEARRGQHVEVVGAVADGDRVARSATPGAAAYSRSATALAARSTTASGDPPGEARRRPPRAGSPWTSVMPSAAASGRDDLDEARPRRARRASRGLQLGDELARARGSARPARGRRRTPTTGRPARVATRSCSDAAKSISPRIARSVIVGDERPRSRRAPRASRSTSPVMSVESTSMTTRRGFDVAARASRRVSCRMRRAPRRRARQSVMTVPFGTTVMPDSRDRETAREVVLVVQADAGALGDDDVLVDDRAVHLRVAARRARRP